jgi:hypothetical protein
MNQSTSGGTDDGNTDIDADVDDCEDGVKVDLNEPELSPGARARAVSHL